MFDTLNRNRSSLHRIAISCRDHPDKPVSPLVDLELLTVLEVDGNHPLGRERRSRVHEVGDGGVADDPSLLAGRSRRRRIGRGGMLFGSAETERKMGRRGARKDWRRVRWLSLSLTSEGGGGRGCREVDGGGSG